MTQFPPERHKYGATIAGAVGDARARAKLARRPDLSSAVLDSLPQRIAVLDAEGVVRKMNEAWRRFARDHGDPTLVRTGLAGGTLAGCRRAASVGEEQAKEVIDGIERVRAGLAERFECEYARHDLGVERWFRLSIAALPGGGRRLLTVHEEITEERKRLAVADRRAAQQSAVAQLGLQALHDDLPVVLHTAVEVAATILSAEYAKIIEVLPGRDALLLRAGVGWAPGCVGGTIAGGSGSQAGFALAAREPVVVEDLRTETRFHATDLLLEHNVVSGVSVVIDGHRGPFGVLGVHTSARRVFSRDDVVFLQTIANIVGAAAERRRAEAELEELRRLACQRERLADVGALAAKVVHDIGNPLAGLSMSAQTVQRVLARGATIPAGAIDRPIERIVSTVGRLDAWISEFKQFLREQRLEVSSVDLSALLREAREAWEEAAWSRRVEILVDPSEDVPPISADDGKLRRVLDNLVKNALEAIDQGPGRVTLGVQAAGSENVLVYVDDTGPGVPAGLDPFALFETSKPTGTGLGLPVVAQIAAAHGGEVRFEARQPRGTRFVLELPVRGATGPTPLATPTTKRSFPTPTRDAPAGS